MAEISVGKQIASGPLLEPEGELRRDINWKGAFWVASGVPALVLFSIGGIAATIGTPSWLVWALSVLMGFIQSFTYAEIAGLFPGKSGGASVYGAIAWVRYNKLIAPISVWCNWLAWTPVLAIGAGLAAGYILNSLFPLESPIHTWQITLLDLSGLKEGLTVRIDATFLLGAALALSVFASQHYGILRAAQVTMIVGLSALIPLLIIGTVPLLTGRVVKENFLPFVPLNGAWNSEGWTLFIGGMFLAAWSTYAFETAVCYTREFKDPKTDTFKAIFYSGLLCIAAFTIVPLSFTGALGLQGLLEPGIVDGSGVGAAMAAMVGGGPVVRGIIIIMLVLALLLAIMTAMGGSSRTLYQASVDGWLPKYLSKVNKYGAPTNAMWTDLVFNLLLLLMSDYLFVLAVSNLCYIIFNFLNLNAGWIHRIDNSHLERPYRAPTWLLTLGAIFSYINAMFMGVGANVWGKGTLLAGLVAAALVIPIFLYRHYIVDKGKYPERMLEDLYLESRDAALEKRAGILPYLTLAAGAAVVAISHYLVS